MIPSSYLKFNPEYLAKGKRSIVYIFSRNNKKFVLKTINPESKAQNRLENEAKVLKLLNKHKIGPKLISSDNDFICMEHLEGIQLNDYLDQKKDFDVIKKVLEQCFILDKLKIIKEEMHKPLKHIFVNKGKVTMIDFERAHSTDKPKNVTQFMQFISRKYKLDTQLKEVLTEYKREQSEKSFKKLLEKLRLLL